MAMFLQVKTQQQIFKHVSFINNQNQIRKHFNDSVEDLIGDCFNEAVQYMNSKRERP